MATTARLGIDITAFDRTKAAFASVERNMGALNRTAQQFKFIMAGFLGGEVLQRMVRSFIDVAKQSAPVKTAMDGLNAAWLRFAQNVGTSGLNEALINFANRMSALIVNTDGLSASIGKFMGGAINTMAVVFEGIGRAMAFVHDNFQFVTRAATVFVAMKLGQYIAWTGLGFLRFAAAARATSLALAIFSAMANFSKKAILGMALAGAALIAGFDEVESAVNSIASTIEQNMGPLFGSVREGMKQLGLDTSALESDLAGFVIGSGLPAAMDKITSGSKTTSTAIKNVSDVSKVGTSAFSAFRAEVVVTKDIIQDAGEVLGQKFRDLFDGLIDGSLRGTGALRSFASEALRNLGKVFLSQGFQQLAALATGGVAPSQQGGFLFGLINSFAGMFANGGALGAGQWGIAGEAGPEIVHGPAQVTPMAKAGGTVIYNIDARGAQQGVAEDIRRMLDQRDRMMPGKIRDARRRALI